MCDKLVIGYLLVLRPILQIYTYIKLISLQKVKQNSDYDS